MNKNSPEKNIICSFPFQVDPVHLFVWSDNVFSKEECEKIIKLAKKQKTIKSEIGLGDVKIQTEKSIRDSEIIWISPTDEFGWLFKKIAIVATELNKKFFNFDILGAIEGLQFTSYKAPTGKYRKHVDRNFGGLVRKLSLTIQLSDPKDYQGGELCLYEGEESHVAGKQQGTVIIFPSFVLHEVRQVTKGQRYSLVTWITGKPFQ